MLRIASGSCPTISRLANAFQTCVNVVTATARPCRCPSEGNMANKIEHKMSARQLHIPCKEVFFVSFKLKGKLSAINRKVTAPFTAHKLQGMQGIIIPCPLHMPCLLLCYRQISFGLILGSFTHCFLHNKNQLMCVLCSLPCCVCVCVL